jgi:nucleoside diphosphate kinase
MLDLKYSEKFYKIILTESVQNLFIARLINSGYELVDSSSFIEIEGEDIISFIPEDRVRRLYKEYQENGGKKEFNSWKYEPECHKEVWTKHRVKMKVGRIFTKILNSKDKEESVRIVMNRYVKDYPEQADIKMNRHIELFVNHFSYKEASGDLEYFTSTN